MTAVEKEEQLIQNKANNRSGVVAHEKWAIRERREAFVLTYGVNTFSEILELFRADYKHTKNKSKEAIYNLYIKYSQAIYFLYSTSSIRNNLVKFKKIIAEEGGRQERNALEIFAVRGVYKSIQKRDTREKKIYHEAQKESKEHFKTHAELSLQIKEIKEKIDKRTYTIAKNQKEEKVRTYYLAILIGLVTGRRFSEILKTLELTTNNRGIYHYSGLLKGNDRGDVRAYFIDLSYREVKKYLTELRELLDTTSIEVDQINSKYSRVFNNAILKIAGIPSFKKMRDDYAQVASQMYSLSIDEVLGHKEIITSGVNYSK